ncbi:hypothetical protein KUCAC02_011801 [Chaenocephalus aceratus]|uniref:Uncharacterized protein n=1 Tax=Chaenocephalus aceratus TaxID=36190 RepID=A0ACB9WX19_CHAAC|nr:hypothetical protein KUCAC02_011801 [Chaenocephalus aceratus]
MLNHFGDNSGGDVAIQADCPNSLRWRGDVAGCGCGGQPCDDIRGKKKREPVRFKQMDGASGTSRCAVATKLNTPLMNALIWLPACCTSGGTAGYQELIQTKCNPPCCK